MEKSKIEMMLVPGISQSTLSACPRPQYDILAGSLLIFHATRRFHTALSVQDQLAKSDKKRSTLKARIFATELRNMKHGNS